MESPSDPEARAELVSVRESMLLYAWFAMKECEPDCFPNVRWQPWAMKPVEHMWVALNVLSASLEGRGEPLQYEKP